MIGDYIFAIHLLHQPLFTLEILFVGPASLVFPRVGRQGLHQAHLDDINSDALVGVHDHVIWLGGGQYAGADEAQFEIIETLEEGDAGWGVVAVGYDFPESDGVALRHAGIGIWQGADDFTHEGLGGFGFVVV